MKPLRKVNLRQELEIPRSWKRILMGKDPHLKVVIKCNQEEYYIDSRAWCIWQALTWLMQHATQGHIHFSQYNCTFTHRIAHLADSLHIPKGFLTQALVPKNFNTTFAVHALRCSFVSEYHFQDHHNILQLLKVIQGCKGGTSYQQVEHHIILIQGATS